MKSEARANLKQEINDRIRAGARLSDNLSRPIIDLKLLQDLALLNPDEREVWVDRRLLDRSLQEIGCDMSLSRERVRQIERRAINKMEDLNAARRTADRRA